MVILAMCVVGVLVFSVMNGFAVDVLRLFLMEAEVVTASKSIISSSVVLSSTT